MSLSQFLNIILPANSSLGMPSATELHIDKSLQNIISVQKLTDFFSILERVAQEKYATKLSLLDTQQYLLCIEKAKRVDIQVVNELVQHSLSAYYTHPGVLRAIPAGPAPPFPEGNSLQSDDWLLLEDVFERGPIFRSVE